jgi:hypothetical protein
MEAFDVENGQSVDGSRVQGFKGSDRFNVLALNPMNLNP